MGCYSKIDQGKIEELRARTHKTVDMTFDQFHNASEDQQVESALQEIGDKFEEDVLDTVDALCKDRNEESTPLLLKEQQELRCRARRQTLKIEGPGDQRPGESFYDRVLRFFERLLQCLSDVLTWVKEKTAPLRSAVKAVWNAVKSFFISMFPSMNQRFLSPLQV